MEHRHLVGSVVPIARLSARDVEALFAVFCRLYENVTERAFETDLNEKDWILLLRDTDDGEIRGFSTLLRLEVEVGGESLAVIFSGDTGIDPAFWGGQALVRTWAHFMGELRAHDPSRRLFWFLISKGYRTYLYLPFFFHRFYPRLDVPTPPFEQALIDALARSRYPRHFNPATGVIEFDVSHGHLIPAIADTPDHRRDHPHVRFFLERNPGYAQGNELVCVAELSPDNMRGVARRMLIEGARSREALV